ncbi:MAG: hypothetical protein Q9167_004543 [Letrouitia subvulpina]
MKHRGPARPLEAILFLCYYVETRSGQSKSESMFSNANSVHLAGFLVFDLNVSSDAFADLWNIPEKQAIVLLSKPSSHERRPKTSTAREIGSFVSLTASLHSVETTLQPFMLFSAPPSLPVGGVYRSAAEYYQLSTNAGGDILRTKFDDRDLFNKRSRSSGSRRIRVELATVDAQQ